MEIGRFPGENITFSYRILGDPVIPAATSVSRKKFALIVSANLSGECYEPQRQFGRYLPDSGANIVTPDAAHRYLRATGLFRSSYGCAWQNFRGEQSEARFRMQVGVVKPFYGGRF